MPIEASSFTPTLEYPLPAITKIGSDSNLTSSTIDTYSYLHSPTISSIPSSPLTSSPLTIMHTNIRTPAMMPLPQAKEAPPKFTGKYEDVKHFLKRYNNLCLAYNVNTEAEKCERVLDYCSHKVIHLIEALKSYTDKNWAALESDLLHYYDADRKETRFLLRDLTVFTHEWKHRSIKSLTRWKKYERKFITIGGWLLAKGKITASEQAAYFWKGINRNLREKIENRLAARTPPLPLTEAFPMSEVIKVVEKLFERNRFDFNLADSDSELPPWDANSDTSEEESASGDSDDEDHVRPASSSKHRKTRKRATYHSSDSDSEIDLPMRPSNKARKSANKTTPAKETKKQGTNKHPEQDDVEQLIRQLGKLSLDDPKYGLLYYRAIKLDTAVAQCVPPPTVNKRPSVTNHSYTQPQFSNSSPRPMLPPRPPTTMTQPPNARPPMICFGCGQTGHGIRTCTPLQEMLQQGTLMRDREGRITFRDGTVVRREQGETIIQAANRHKGMQSHFFAMNQDEVSEYYQSEGEPDDEYEADVLAAEHQPKLINKTRKEVFDGVVIPPKRGKENVRPAGNVPPKTTPAQSTRMPERTGMGTRANPSKPDNIPTTNGRAQKGPQEFKSIPMDVRQPRKILDSPQDIEMEDVHPQDQSQNPEKSTPAKLKAPLRQSQVSAQVGETQVVTTILNTPVTMRIGEVLASSRELSDQLTDLLKRKNPKPASVNHTVLGPQDAGKLIRIPLQLEGRKVFGIIDTGSELNVINRKIIRGLTEAPIDPRRKVVMNDANGGAGNLKGHISDVLLKCGNVKTFANLYVGDTVPFDLLLGRPWQRDNLVSIDERTDGTYLIFKDPQNIEITYELLVEDHATKPEYPFDIHKPPTLNHLQYTVAMLRTVPENGQLLDDIAAAVQSDFEIGLDHVEQNNGDTRPISPRRKEVDMLELFHMGNCFTYLKNKSKSQRRLLTEAATECARFSMHQEARPIFRTPAQTLGLSAAFSRALRNFFVSLISRTNNQIVLKYQQDTDEPQDTQIFQIHLYHQTISRDMPSLAPNSTVFPHPLTMPSNDTPLPPPADASVLTLSTETHQRQLDTLNFLWDGYLIGEEDLHPVILTSPFGMHFDQRQEGDHLINHAVMYDASLIFLHPYPNPPSIRSGNAHISFFEHSPSSPSSNHSSNDSPPPAPGAGGISSTPPSTPINLEMIDGAPDPADHSLRTSHAPRSLSRAPINGVLPGGETPDTLTQKSSNPAPGFLVNPEPGSQKCVCHFSSPHTGLPGMNNSIHVIPVYENPSQDNSKISPPALIVEVTVAQGDGTLSSTTVPNPLVYCPSHNPITVDSPSSNHDPSNHQDGLSDAVEITRATTTMVASSPLSTTTDPSLLPPPLDASTDLAPALQYPQAPNEQGPHKFFKALIPPSPNSLSNTSTLSFGGTVTPSTLAIHFSTPTTVSLSSNNGSLPCHDELSNVMEITQTATTTAVSSPFSTMTDLSPLPTALNELAHEFSPPIYTGQ